METAWQIYEGIAVTAFTFSLIVGISLLVTEWLAVRRAKARDHRWHTEFKALIENEQARENLRRVLGTEKKDSDKDDTKGT